jgi:hypothetical protein
MVFVFASFVGGVSEGVTKQYDNLVCMVFFYTVLLQTHNFFIEMAYN